MSAQLLGFKSKGADAIVTISYGIDGSLILKQIKQLGLPQPVIASSGVMVPAAHQPAARRTRSPICMASSMPS